MNMQHVHTDNYQCDLIIDGIPKRDVFEVEFDPGKAKLYIVYVRYA